MRKARESAGYSQQELADIMGVARTTVANCEGDRHAVRRIVYNAWSAACQVPLEWLMGEAIAHPPVRKGEKIERRHGPADRRVRHQGFEPRTRWFDASPTVEVTGNVTNQPPECPPQLYAA